MKLSYRDKVIFIVAIVIIIFIAGFFIFIKPRYDKMNSAKATLDAKVIEKQGVEDKINTLPILVSQLKEIAASVEETQSHFLTEQDPYLNEQFIHEILNQSNVEVRSMETEYTAADNAIEYMVPIENVLAYDLQIQGDLYNELPQEVYDKYNSIPDEQGSIIIVGITSMTIGYKDSLELTKVFNFIDTIAEDDRTMSVLTVGSGESTSGDNTAEGSITMRLYSIFPLNIDKIMEETDEVEILPVVEAALDQIASEEPAA